MLRVVLCRPEFVLRCDGLCTQAGTRGSPRVVPDVDVRQLRPHLLLQLEDHVELQGRAGQGRPVAWLGSADRLHQAKKVAAAVAAAARPAAAAPSRAWATA